MKTMSLLIPLFLFAAILGCEAEGNKKVVELEDAEQYMIPAGEMEKGAASAANEMKGK